VMCLLVLNDKKTLVSRSYDENIKIWTIIKKNSKIQIKTKDLN